MHNGFIKRNNFENNGDFYCLNCFHSFRTYNKLKSQEKVSEKKNSWGTVFSIQKINTLEFYQYMKSERMLNIIYADIESSVNTNS